MNGDRKHVMTYLGDFLFAPERARSPVKSLSGGERNRLLLARLFAKPANVLVLDEPTNDLDIDTLELLEQLLEDYAGTVFLVSHDRVFLDNVVTQVFVAEGEGVWREYIGGYSDWERVRSPSAIGEQKKPSNHQPARSPQSTSSSHAARASSASPSTHSSVDVAVASGTANMSGAVPAGDTPTIKPKKLSFKEQRELEQLPQLIEQLENEQSAITARLADPSLYRQAPSEAQQLNQRYAEIDTLLLQALERWEAIASRAPSS